MEASKVSFIKGGEFLIRETSPENTFSPEDYTEEMLMFRTSMRDFLNKEIEPIKEKFDSKEGTRIAPGLLEKMGLLGFHGIGIPEEFGGLNCDFKTELAFGEIASDSFAFAQSIGVHTGLGIYPVLLYGTKEQKDKYLTKIVTAEIKCSYCLTEPGAGSDANAGKTQALYSEDKKHFILNGQKMWITNSGFADVFFVFCKIEDDAHLSCLIVEKNWGVTLGEEERKLGIHGSSTRQVFFENVKVPVENLLGERNKGFKIAMNALNAGRIKIAVANTAIAKRAFGLGLNYANQRVQFGEKIANFGAIQEKIANSAIKMYANESSWNRVAHMVDLAYEEMTEKGMDPLEAKYKSVADYAIECSITKVYGSEMEQYVVDEALQIHGGMGYSAESEIETLYRNVRGNRIYEGTNEINRILIPSTILRKAMKGEISLMEEAMKAFQDLQSGTLKPAEGNFEDFSLQLSFLENAKKVCILTLGQAVQTFQQNIKDEQEILMRSADMIIQLYNYESALLRCIKHRNATYAEISHAMVDVLMYDTADLLKTCARDIIYACPSGDMAAMSLRALNKLCQLPVCNLKDKKRQIAAHFITENKYSLA
jgi:alkylation response protein AidB-like acyl-CoA dehydrogenase